MRIYLDHNATTPLRPEVLETMRETLGRAFGNPSSTHAEGAEARAAVDGAREEVASVLGVRRPPKECVIFTAGATEANTALLRFGGWESRGRHVVSTSTEHPSVLEPLAELEARGHEVTRVGVDKNGLLDPAAVADAIREDTGLVSVIWANNETGVLAPMQKISQLVQERGVLLHADATQALGKIPVDVEAVPVDYLSVSAHKLNGPKGTGCLYVRRQTGLASVAFGGRSRGWVARRDRERRRDCGLWCRVFAREQRVTRTQFRLCRASGSTVERDCFASCLGPGATARWIRFYPTP